MVKVKFSVPSRKRRKKILEKAKGQRGGRSRLIRTAKESVQKGMTYAYRDRKKKKSEFRQLWITRIRAQAEREGISYSRFINGLHKRDIELDRKILAEVALRDKSTFAQLVAIAKEDSI